VSDDLIVPTLIMLRGLAARARSGLSRRTNEAGAEEGASTLEMVIITLGLIAVATILVAAITVAVTRRANQIK
jgi:hypothetical protein